MLNTIGIFDLPALTNAERLDCGEKRHYFWFGEVGMAAMLAGVFAVPLGIFMASRAEITLAFIGAAVLFLPLFVFLPKLIQKAMKADTDAAIEAFGKNEQVKSVLDPVRGNGRAGAGPGCGPGDSSAGCEYDYGYGWIKPSFPILSPSERHKIMRSGP